MPARGDRLPHKRRLEVWLAPQQPRRLHIVACPPRGVRPPREQATHRGGSPAPGRQAVAGACGAGGGKVAVEGSLADAAGLLPASRHSGQRSAKADFPIRGHYFFCAKASRFQVFSVSLLSDRPTGKLRHGLSALPLAFWPQGWRGHACTNKGRRNRQAGLEGGPLKKPET